MPLLRSISSSASSSLSRSPPTCYYYYYSYLSRASTSGTTASRARIRTIVLPHAKAYTHAHAHVPSRVRVSANCCAINPRQNNKNNNNPATGTSNFHSSSKSTRESDISSSLRPSRLHPKKPVSAAGGSHPIRSRPLSLSLPLSPFLSLPLRLVPLAVPGSSSFCATTSPATPNPQRLDRSISSSSSPLYSCPPISVISRASTTYPLSPSTSPASIHSYLLSNNNSSSSSRSRSSIHSGPSRQLRIRSFHTGQQTRPSPTSTRSHYPAKPTFASPSSSSSSGHHNHHHHHNHHDNRYSKYYTYYTTLAATSTSIALLGIYSIADTDSDPNLPTLRSLLDWWSTTDIENNNNNKTETNKKSTTTTTPPPTPPPPPPTATMASTAPGRPETLTPEQEVKLKEFWNVTLSLFGQSASQLEETSLADDAAGLTLDSTAAEEEGAAAGAAEAEGAAGTGGKTKSKRSKLFSRSKKDKEKKEKDKDSKKDDSVNSSRSNLTVPETTLSNRPSPPPGLTVDPEDKYNQGKDFKAALASQTPEELRTTFWGFVKYDNPDALLLRFLRARKWDVEKALVMMVSTMHWRGQEVFVEKIALEGEATAFAAEKTDKTAEGFMKQLRMGKSYIHGTDREERPICYVNVRLHKAADQTPESLERYTIYLIETTRMMLKQPVDTAAIVFDMTGFGMANMDYTPVKFMIKCFEAHYPECLGICLVHNAPWIFQGIWKIIRGWLDPVVASKVHFTTKTTDLTEFIALSQLPKSLGGDEDWEYKYIEPTSTENPAIATPTPADTAEKESLEEERLRIIEEYEKNTREWIREESKGAKVDTDVKDERSGLRERLRTNYWGLDKFLRARTWYDRVGMVGKNGEVDFYPKNFSTNGNLKTEENKVNGNGASAAASVPAHPSDEDDELD
ncbi:hypothetical protein TWF730_000624 [Orbilia blumenaviensis]|uniref:CRAL-TRIO domain-containing protein n=1 Tax=Orbilia blumenaviensis TaxID=1796055 RepID=A0AAV9VT97_9PEZI